jgi:dGTPase
LQLNEDLVEALALFHDIGHPPFGHAGEDALDECLRDEGGFSHNEHALTIAEEIDVRYHGFPGLNLTREVLDGQGVRADKQNPDRKPLLEVQLVDVADSITYDAHDTDDAVKLGLIRLEELAELALIREMLHRVNDRFASLSPRVLRQTLVHELIDYQVSDVLRHGGEFLATAELQNAQQARLAPFLLGPSDQVAVQKTELERFLYDRVYRHPEIIRVRDQAQNRLREMFARYVRQPDLLPKRYLIRSESIGLPRSVGEYLAGMTDRFCNEQYERHSN